MMADLTEKRYYAKPADAKTWHYTVRRTESPGLEPQFAIEVSSNSPTLKVADVRALISALEAALIGT